MQEMQSIIVRPCARGLILYYAIALSIIAAFAAGAIIGVIPMQNFEINPWYCALGVIGGIGILAIVVWIHLEMKFAVYTVTECDAQSHSGLLFKRNDLIQLGAVRTIQISQGPVQHAFNVGNIILRTTGHSTLVFWDVDQPERKKEEIWDLVTKASTRIPIRHSIS